MRDEPNRGYIPLWPDTLSGQWGSCLSSGHSALPPPTFGPSAKYAGQCELSQPRSAEAGSLGDDVVEHFLSQL
jgi:hypothetical protein